MRLMTLSSDTNSITAILGGLVTVAILFLLPETLRCRVGNGSLYNNKHSILVSPALFSPLAPQEDRSPPPPKPTLLGYWRMFCYPPVGLVSFNTAILYSSYFCVAVALSVDLPTVYGWSTAGTGGAYVAVGVAIVVGSLVGGRLSDYRRARGVAALKKQAAAEGNGAADVPPPEARLVDQIWGVLLCAAGCAMYGWFVEKRVHPAGTLIATFLSTYFLVSMPLTPFERLADSVPQSASACPGSLWPRRPS